MPKIRPVIQEKIEREAQENNKPFICIYQLIEILTNNDECSFIESANFLGSIIEKNTQRIETLCYLWQKIGYTHKLFISFKHHYIGVNYKIPQNSHFELLVNILKRNTFDDHSIVFLNDYGVERNVFSKLLAENGILINLDAEPSLYAVNESKPLTTVPIVDSVQKQEPVKAATKASIPTETNWRHIVQQEAWRYWLTLRAMGANPSVHSIEDRMANWCNERNLVGSKGFVVKGKTLRNTVLGGEHWTHPNHSPEQARKALEKLPELPEAPLPGA